MADQATKLRFEKLEKEQDLHRNRIHDALNLAQECKFRLDEDVKNGEDRESRLRIVEIYVEQQKGKAMQNKAILGIIGLLAGLAGELLGKFL